jgi:hypothetical protein
MAKKIKTFGTWAVTSFGIESTTNTTYDISRQALHQDWPRHMAEKGWVNMRDFKAAYEFAKAHFAKAKA